MISRFHDDLKKEALLGKYLDTLYPQLFPGFKIRRITDSDQQHQGIDIIISRNGQDFYIDEKAQLDYINKSVRTFAFEVTYINKDGEQKLGWLFDKHKITNRYFLITDIYLHDSLDISKGIKSCAVTSVDRSKLVILLKKKGLDFDKIISINQEIRGAMADGATNIAELLPKSEGRFHFSKSNKAEEPINILLYLKYLVKEGVAKKVEMPRSD